jgi:hypothetical protein
MVFGGLFHKAENISKLCDFLVGKKASKEIIADAVKVLQEEIKDIEDEEVVETVSGATAVRKNAGYRYPFEFLCTPHAVFFIECSRCNPPPPSLPLPRMNLAAGFLLKYLLSMSGGDVDSVTIKSLSTHSERPLTKSSQDFDYPSTFFFLY